MVSPVKSRLTHYEILGLGPAATPNEIAEAFAQEIQITISSPEEAIEHASRIYTAYGILRDPIKRRLYDAAIGLWDPKATAEQRVAPFIAVSAGESPDQGLHGALAGGTPGPKHDQQRGRKANKAAIEWPVPQAKSLDERTADVGAGTPSSKPGRAKNERRRLRRAKSNREARRSASGSAKKGPHSARPDSKAATDRGAVGAPKKRRPQAKRADKAAPGRVALHAAPERRKSAIKRAVDPTKEGLRDGALDRADQVRSIAGSDEATTSRFAGAGAGVMIAAFGILTLVVALVRGNYDQTPTVPPRPMGTNEQPSIPSTEKATVPGKDPLSADETRSETSSIGSMAGLNRQVSDTPHVAPDTRAMVDLLAGTPVGQADDQQATAGHFEQNASRNAVVTPSRQSVTEQHAATPPEQLQLANRQLARTPPRPAPYGQPSSAAQGKPGTQVDAGRKVLSSGIEEKICTHLPLTGTRVPQRVCLTSKEWKQVEEEQRYAGAPSQPLPPRQTSSRAQGKPGTQGRTQAGRYWSSAIDEKICTHLPLTGTRVPQRVCLTSTEWKQVAEAQR